MVPLASTLLGLSLLAQAPPPDPGAAMARAIPAEKLVLYVEYDGLAAHAKGWKETAAYRLLNRTKAGAMMEDVAVQVVDGLLPPTNPGKPTGAELIAIQEQVLDRGFAFGVYPWDATIAVFRGAGKPESRPPIERLLSLLALAPGQKLPAPAWIRGRTIVMVKRDAPPPSLPELPDIVRTALPLPPATEPGLLLAWWSEGTDLIVADGVHRREIEEVLDGIEGKRPTAATHQARRALLAERGIDSSRPVCSSPLRTTR